METDISIKNITANMQYFFDEEEPRSREDCQACSLRQEFGFRPRETFSISNDNVCTCVIDERVYLDFVMWLRYHGITLNTPTREGIIYELNNIPRLKITEGFFSSEVLDHVSQYVENVLKIMNYRIKSWEYYDIGCGNGKISRAIAERLGVMTRHADTTDIRIGKYGIIEYEDFHIINSDGKVPIKNTSIMLVTCFLVLHHFIEPQKILQEIYRILRPGGIVIIEEFDVRSWERAYACDYMHQTLGTIIDCRSVTTYRSRDGWRSLFEETGFSQINNPSIKYPPQEPYQIYFDVFRKPEANDCK